MIEIKSISSLYLEIFPNIAVGFVVVLFVCCTEEDVLVSKNAPPCWSYDSSFALRVVS